MGLTPHKQGLNLIASAGLENHEEGRQSGGSGTLRPARRDPRCLTYRWLGRAAASRVTCVCRRPGARSCPDRNGSHPRSGPDSRPGAYSAPARFSCPSTKLFPANKLELVTIEYADKRICRLEYRQPGWQTGEAEAPKGGSPRG